MKQLTYRPRLEPLEDRRLLATCNVVRLGDFGAGHVLGNFARGDLRFCINYANSKPGPDAINLNVTGTIQPTNDLPKLGTDMTITGPGADLLAVDGNAGRFFTGTIFHVLFGATVSISGLTITRGFEYEKAGGIRNDGGTLTLIDSTVSNNLGSDGGGFGGGIFNSGKMTISGSTISGNGVVFAEGQDKGGGIYNDTGGVMNILNSTISENYVWIGSGGGIYNKGSLDIRFSTITQNSSGGGALSGGGIYTNGSLSVQNTIIAGNSAPDGPDVYGNLGSVGYNLIGNTSDGSGYDGTDLLNVDPLLGPLQDNGGFTQTMALLPGSPAIDAGDPNPIDPPDWDQRGPGFPRIVNGTIDIGAFELQATGAPSDSWRDLAVLITAEFDD